MIIIICKKKASKSMNSSDQMKTCLIGSDEVVEYPSNTLTSQRLFVSMATMTDISMVVFCAENPNETVVEAIPSRPGTSSTTLPPLSPIPSEDENIYHSRNDMVVGIRTDNIDVTSTGGGDEQDYTNEHYGLHPQDGDLSLDDPGPGASNDKVKVIHLPLTSQDTSHGTEGVQDNHEMRDTAQFMEGADGSANILFPVGSHTGQDSPHIRMTNAEQGYIAARSSELAVVVGTEQEESSGHKQTSDMVQERNNQRTFETLQDGQVSQPMEQSNTPVLNSGRISSHITVNQAEQITSNSQIGGPELPRRAPGKTEQSSASIIYNEQGSTQMMLVHEQTRQTDQTISQMIAEHGKESSFTSGTPNRNQASSRLDDSSSNFRFVSEGATQQLREVHPVLVHSITNVVLSELRQQGMLKTANISIDPKYVEGEPGGVSSQTQNSQVPSHRQRLSNVSRPVSREGLSKTINETATCVTGGSALIQRETTGPMLSYRKSNLPSSLEPRFPLGPGVEVRQLKENWQFERGTFVKEFSKDVSSATIITNLEDTNIPGQPLYD
ncbi:hypothetical protein ACJMK2_031250 [Sinanodonta woodiana]